MLAVLATLVGLTGSPWAASAAVHPDSVVSEVASEPTVDIVGAPVVGSVLTAVAAGFSGTDVLTFAWSAGGVALPDTVGAALTLEPRFLGAPVSVTVTGSSPGEPDRTASATIGPVAAGTLGLTGTPSISGTPQVGAVLNGRAGSWDPLANLAYQWLASGVPLAGATTPTFSPGPAQLGQPITLRVTAVREGYRSVAATSAPTAPVGAGAFVASPTPTISGTLRVGRVLTATPGTWSPAASLSYQWRANGAAIASATGRTYTLQPTDRTKRMTVQVTGRRSGYAAVARTSSATAAVDYGLFAAAPVPSIGGTVQIRSTVRVVPGTWSPSADLSYQWRVNGVAISGATGATFLIPTAYLGKGLSVTVTARRTGYAALGRTSAARSVTQPFTGAPSPTISAQLVRVGWVIRASSSTWSPVATLAVQWRRDGVAIPGATGWTYRMTTTDLGKRMTATVTGRRSGYTTTSRTSAASAAVLAAPYGFTNAGTPATPPVAPYARSVIRTLTDAQWAKITAAGVWRPTGCPGTRTTFRRVEVPYWGLDGKTHRGYVNVNADVARSTVKIFDTLYAKHFPMHRVEGVENWGGWEWLASKANASTAMNCRKPSEANSSNAYSPHAWGRAIDLNPVQNPYVNPHTGIWDPNPPPPASTAGAIRYGSLAYDVVTSFGWYWSGNDSWHDYMHFDTGYPSNPRGGLRVTQGAAGHGRL